VDRRRRGHRGRRTGRIVTDTKQKKGPAAGRGRGAGSHPSDLLSSPDAPVPTIFTR
jgi:hypothetical protein